MMNKPGEKGNYFESSSACMFVYALAKGVRHGYLPDLSRTAFSPSPNAATKASSRTSSKPRATTFRSPTP